MNNAISDIKNTLEGTNSRITEAKDGISKVEDSVSVVVGGAGFLFSGVQ